MADEPISVENLKYLLTNGDLLVETIKDLGSAFVSADSNAGGFKDKFQSLTASAGTFGQGVDRGSSSLTKMAEALTGAALVADKFTTNLFGASHSLKAFSEAQKGAFGTASIVKNLEQTGNVAEKLVGIFGKVGASAIEAFAGTKVDNMEKNGFFNSFKEGEARIKARSEALKTAMKEGALALAQNLQHVQDLERGFLSLHASTGNLREVFEDGSFVEDFDKRVNNFALNLHNISKATGIDAETIASSAAELGKIPGMLVDTEQGLKNYIDTTKIAAGAGMTLSDAQATLRFAWEHLNKTGAEGVEVLGQIASLSYDLSIPIEEASEAVRNFGTKYEFLTDKTEGVTRALAAFVPAMKEVGLSPKQAIAMFDNLTSSVLNMDRAQKAFLAGRSGLGGGLQGAFKIDEMLAQGKEEEVFKMLEDNLKRQFGGRTVTRAEAAESQSAAVQYQKQLSYIQSGAFGGIFGKDAQGEAKAAKFFEAMNKGGVMRDVGVLTGEAAKETAVKRGDGMQKRMHDAVAGMANHVQKIATTQELLLGATLRGIVGGGDSKTVDVEIAKSRTLGERAAAGYASTNKVEGHSLAMGAVDELSQLFMLGKDAVTKDKNALGQREPKLNNVHTDRVAHTLQNSVQHNIRTAQAPTGVSTATVRTAATPVSGQSSSQPQRHAVQVTGTIEGICIKCNEKMVAGHLHDATVDEIQRSQRKGLDNHSGKR